MSSVLPPAACTRSRSAANSSTMPANSGPISCSSRRRSHDDSAGLAPPVEVVIIRLPRRTTAGSVNEQRAGSSALFTQIPSASASSKICWSTVTSPVAVTTSR
jgi:hypothetical protein